MTEALCAVFSVDDNVIFFDNLCGESLPWIFSPPLLSKRRKTKLIFTPGFSSACSTLSQQLIAVGSSVLDTASLQ